MTASARLVLVTGATGFTGRHAVARLLEAGHRVRALVRSADKARTLLEPLGLMKDDFVVGDMTDAEAVAQAVAGCDAVIHAAAAVSVTKAGGGDPFEANVEGARVVLGAARAAGLDPIVFVSSMTAILDPKNPRATRADSPLVESATRYGRSKAASDRLARALRDGGAPIAIVYPSGIIGPDDPGRSESMSAFRSFLQFMIETEGGTQFVDVRDVGLLLERIVTERFHGGVVAAGTFFTWRDLRRTIADVTGARIGALRAPGPVIRGAGRAADLVSRLTGRSLVFTHESMEIATRWRPIDDSPALAELGVRWRPAEDTLRDTYAWFLERGAIRPEAAPRLARGTANPAA
jgi:nucleoside-diphosphate-sugar epimerase